MRITCTGDPPGRPYRCIHNPNNPMEMIRHNDEFIFVYFNLLADLGGFQPFFTDDFAGWVQTHTAFNALTKEFLALIGTYGHEIRAGMSVIISFQANGSPVVNLRIISPISFPVGARGACPCCGACPYRAFAHYNGRTPSAPTKPTCPQTRIGAARPG